MNIRIHLFLAAFLFVASAVSGGAEAKDLIFGLGNEMVQVIDAETDHITNIPIKGAVRDTDFSADKKFFYAIGNRRYINQIDIAKGRLVKTIEIDGKGWEHFIYGFVLGDNGQTAYVHTMSRRTDKGEVLIGTPSVSEIDLGSGKIVRSVEVPWGVANLALVKGGTTLYAVGQDIYMIDVTKDSMKLVETYSMFDKGINALAFWHYTQENGGIWLTPYYTATRMGLLGIDVRSGQITETLIEGDPVFAYNAVYSPDGTKAYAVMDEVSVIDLKTKTYQAIVPIPEGTCYGVAFTADGKKLYVGGGGSTLTVFDVETMRPMKVIQLNTDGMGLRRITL